MTNMARTITDRRAAWHWHRFMLAAAVVLLASAFPLRLGAQPAPVATARVLPIAERAWARSSVNVVANVRQSLFTHSRTQYAAFYDAEGFMVLARRALGSDTWETQRTAHRGRVADAHNSISLAVDGEGRLHVAWDHHGSPLNYARATAPGALTLAEKTSMTGQRENRVTYPQFLRLPDGDLLFLYRDGESGRGALVLNRYSAATGRWSQVQSSLIDGQGRSSPYWGLSVDKKGALHLAWIWRDSPDVATNHDLAYARSIDGGRTWTRSDGGAYELPITPASAEYALRISPNSNLMNPPCVAADDEGHPYIATYWSPTPGAPPRYHVVKHDGAAWRVIPGPATSTAFSLAGQGTKRPPISRAILLVEQDWRMLAIHLVYRDDRRGGRILAATLQEREGPDWSVRELTRDTPGAWEPSFDPIQWDRFRQVHMLVQDVAQIDGNDRDGAEAAATPIGTLVWSPNAERLSAQKHTPAEPVAPDQLARSLAAPEVMALMQRVADWQLAHRPAPEHRHPRGWEMAPFYIGALALDGIAPQRRYQDAILRQCEDNDWEPHHRMYHADDHCVIQAYLELYRLHRDPRMLAPSKKRLDAILARPSTVSMDWDPPKCQERWTWCDALFMAPMSWLLMWEATGEARYLDFMNREWWATTERLYSPAVGLYFRDESFLDLREPNGRTIHWARGNGWVFGGLCRVLDLLPKDHPDRPRYLRLYREMAAAFLAAQQPDGLWRPGLLDAAAHPARETSGSSFITFGLAWGLNRGLLDHASYETAVRRAWNALSLCVTAEGRLEHVQPIGAAPQGFDPRTSEPFAVGALLLAGSEVYRLAAQDALPSEAQESRLAAKPLYRDPVYDGAADPVVIWNPHQRRWWMFYTNRRANVPGLSGVAWVHGTRIGIAESTDGGARWSYVGTADIEIPAEIGGREPTLWAPDVITAPDGTHHMFLTVVPGVFEDWRHPRAIVHLTSRDLRVWRDAQALELASDRVIDASALRLPDGSWRLWYNNERDGKSIYYADSPDLRTWTDRGRAVGDQSGEGPKAFRWQGACWLITDVWRGLAVYRSDDCLNWIRQAGGNLLEQPGRGADDGVKGGHADVVMSGDRAFLFYFTHPGRSNPQLDPNSQELRRSSLQVVELKHEDGRLTCDRDEPTRIRLRAP